MKKILAVATCAAVIGLAGSAYAVPTTWVDSIDFTPDVLVPPTASYFHDIGDDVNGVEGFSSWRTGGDDTIDSFELDVTLYDDNIGTTKTELRWTGWRTGWQWETVTKADGSESAKITVSLFDWTYVNPATGTITIDPSFSGTVDIWEDGTLNVWVSSTKGDFYLDKSVLTVYGDDGTSAVPEPTTMLLFGTGLAGLAGVARRKRK